jgi:uncharacterized protein (DUF1800 family)
VSAFEGAIAANRFGFGAAPGDLQRIGGQAQSFLQQQLRLPAPLLSDSLPASHELLARVLEARRDAAGSEQPRPCRRPAPCATYTCRLLG